MPVFRLQFPLELVPAYAARYTDDDADVPCHRSGSWRPRSLHPRRVPQSVPVEDPEERSARPHRTATTLWRHRPGWHWPNAVSDRERVKELQSLRGVVLPIVPCCCTLSTPIAFPSSTSGLSTRSECRRHRTATGSGSPTSPSIGGWSVRPGSTDARSTRLSGSGRGSRVHSSDHLCSSARTLSRAGVLAQPCGFDRRDVPFSLLLHDEAQLAAECPASRAAGLEPDRGADDTAAAGFLLGRRQRRADGGRCAGTVDEDTREDLRQRHRRHQRRPADRGVRRPCGDSILLACAGPYSRRSPRSREERSGRTSRSTPGGSEPG